MSSAKKPDKDTSSKGAHAPSGNGADTPAWADGLKQLYDSVVDEPLPDSFKDLLDAFDESSGPIKKLSKNPPQKNAPILSAN